MKKCPFCFEEIQDEALKCRYCGEFLNKDKKIDVSSISTKDEKFFDDFIDFVKSKYPAYSVASKQYEKKYIILQKKLEMNPMILIVLLLLWIVPGVIYALVCLVGNRQISLTIYFDENSNPVSISNKKFSFLIKKYKELNPS